MKQPSRKFKTRKVSVAAQAAAKAKRLALSEASREAKALIEIHEMLTGEALGVNEMLVKGYRADTGQAEFKTFHEWKKSGFCIVKGSTGFSVWGTPRKTKGGETVDEGGAVEEGKEYELFPVCTLFHRGQVQAFETEKEPASA